MCLVLMYLCVWYYTKFTIWRQRYCFFLNCANKNDIFIYFFSYNMKCFGTSRKGKRPLGVQEGEPYLPPPTRP